MKILSKNRESLKGDVVFVFQNSEETTKGAKELIRNIAKAFSCEVRITYTDDIDLVYNSEDMYELARAFAEEIVGRDNVV